MADSGTYDQATILRRQKIAEQMLAESSKPQPIRHWAQGLAQLANVGSDAFALNRLDKQAGEARKTDTAALMGLLGGTTPPPAPAAPVTPAPAATPSPDMSVPRGIRNNNPLNIEAGDFTKGQPGFAGSDGRFAKFQTPEQGTDAASKLLDVYSTKHGLNTVGGIVNRWAPPSDNNPSQAYVASVAGRMGVAPDATLNMADPDIKRKIIAAMGQFENGRPIPASNQVAGPGAPSGMPPAAPQATPQPPAGPGAVAAAMTPQAAPASPQTAPLAAQNAPQGIPDQQKRAIAAMLSATPGSPAHTLGVQLIGQSLKPKDYGFQTLPDGTILRTDPHAGTVQPIYQAPSKPTFGVIGEDPFGNKTHGWIDPYKQTAVPVSPGGAGQPGGGAPAAPLSITGPGGEKIAIPEGQDPKKFREHVTTASADAAVGKFTEVQQKANQFATRMELAEKNVAPLEGEALGVKGAAQQIAGQTPVIGSAMQSEKYQKYEQAKSQFITALLRQESGAAVNKTEFSRYEKELFPQPGDGPDVIAQKREARRAATDAMRKGAGAGSKAVTPLPGAAAYDAPAAPPPAPAASAPAEGATASNPKTGERMIFQGGKWTPLT